MNMVLISRGTRSTRHWAITQQILHGLAGAFFLSVITSFALGFLLAHRGGPFAPDERIDALSAQLTAQHEVVSNARATAQGQVDALAMKLGELNANVIRLNALGSRLVRMAKLDDGEFDFSQPPGVGGPEEPASASVPATELTHGLDLLDQKLASEQEQLAILANLMVDRKLQEDVRPRGRPVRSGYISSDFGLRTDPFTGRTASHRGVDFASQSGTAVVAVATGVVTWSGVRAGYGRMVEVVHGNGYVTRYAHNAQNLVAVGDHVDQGQTIALMGSTGRATGPNLHFEVWYQGQPINPARFIQRAT